MSKLRRSCSSITLAAFLWSYATGKLTGIVSEDDFIRRSEIGTQRRPGRWLDFIFRPEQSAIDYIRQHSRKISEIMASVPVTDSV